MAWRLPPALAALVLAAGMGPVLAQSVALTGVLGQRALLVVDGAGPRSLAVGESWRGVKLLALQGDQAELEIAGKRTRVRLGEAPASVGAATAAKRIVLQADGRGHFTGNARINGQIVPFMVDTGASTLAMDAAQAERLGIAYRSGTPVRLGTANGVVQGWAIQLSTLRLGETELHGVDAVVVPLAMPYVLLGNNVLARFQMTRGQDQMVLEQRY